MNEATRWSIAVFGVITVFFMVNASITLQEINYRLDVLQKEAQR